MCNNSDIVILKCDDKEWSTIIKIDTTVSEEWSAQ